MVEEKSMFKINQNVSPKSKKRLSLTVYFCILSVVSMSEDYGISTLIVFGVANVITTSATCFYMAFLMSRKPAEKTILNRQILMKFCFKIPVNLQTYMLMCVKHLSQARPLNVTEHFLGSTVLSWFAFRLSIVFTVSMYIIISVARTIVFISPVAFISINTKKIQCFSILILLTLLAEEVVVYLTFLSADKCHINQFG